jgi:leader peptidase (prepilin peptidase)/N-methyltransferase
VSSLLETAWPFVAAAFGLVIGSFANVCIHRLPLQQSVVTPRSRCPRCQTMIGAADNVPLLSWLWLRGRCRVCAAPISARYPLVEAGNAALYGMVARGEEPGLRAVVSMAFATALLILGLIDLEHQILPDVITLPFVVAGLAASLLAGPPTPLSSAGAALGGYVVFMLLALTWRRLRGIEALGQGDWKMAAMLGAFFGWEKLVLTVFLATLAGTVVGLGAIAFGGRTLQHRLPLGTFLSAAGLAVLLVGDPLWAWYRGFLLPAA